VGCNGLQFCIKAWLLHACCIKSFTATLCGISVTPISTILCAACPAAAPVFLLQMLQEPDQVSFALLNMMTAVLAQVRAAVLCNGPAVQQQSSCLKLPALLHA
jgi:hypothetical protein